MPQLQPNNPFASYVLSAEEQIQASTFNELQLCMLYNERFIAANAKLNMRFDPEHPQSFIQEEAELQGKLNMLNWLIEQHNVSQAEYLRLEIAAKQAQQD